MFYCKNLYEVNNNKLRFFYYYVIIYSLVIKFQSLVISPQLMSFVSEHDQVIKDITIRLLYHFAHHVVENTTVFVVK